MRALDGLLHLQGGEGHGCGAEGCGRGLGGRAGLTHLLHLLAQTLHLRVLLIDEVELGEVALLHWGRAAGRGQRHTETEIQAEEGDTETNTEQVRARESHRDPEMPGERRTRERDGRRQGHEGRSTEWGKVWGVTAQE